MHAAFCAPTRALLFACLCCGGSAAAPDPADPHRIWSMMGVVAIKARRCGAEIHHARAFAGLGRPSLSLPGLGRRKLSRVPGQGVLYRNTDFSQV